MKLLGRLFLIFVVTAVLALLTLPALAASSHIPAEIDEDNYWKLVQDSLDAIKRLDGLSGEPLDQTLANLTSQWEGIVEVEVDGYVTPVNNGYLIQLLQAEQPELDKIEGIFASLIEAHQTYPKQVFSSADLDPLHQILSQPEFAWQEFVTNPVNDWLQQIWERINRWLNDILGDRSFSIPLNQNWLTLIASFLLALVLYFVFRTLFIDFTRETRLSSELGDENEPITSEAAFEKAQSLSRSGDYRSAVRYLYLSALLIMDERGVLRYDRSKTNREYLRSVSGSPDLSEPLEEVIDVFDNVWYGYHALEEDSFKQYSNRVEELKEKKA
jgi:hypothetical protein